MKPFHYYALSFLLLASACVYNDINGQNNTARFEPPLVTKQWQMQEYPKDAHDHLCVISAGHNAIEVIMKKATGSNALEEIVHSTRNVAPGTTLEVRIDRHNYRIAGGYFPLDMSKKIIADMQTGNTVYLEWHENSTRRYGNADRFFNMAPLAQFKEKYRQCQRILGAG
jgi:hypothetical protein